MEDIMHIQSFCVGLFRTRFGMRSVSGDMMA